MAWVRFDDGFFRHPKVVAAGRDARDVFMASVCYANANLTDGFIPEGALRMIAADAGINSHTKAVKSLLSNRLWFVTDGGYQIHDYLDYQVSAASVTASQSSNRKRQQEWRNKNRNAKDNGQRNGVTNSPVTDTDKNIDINTTSDEVVTPRPPKAKPAKPDLTEPTAPNGTAGGEHPFALLESMCKSLGVDATELTNTEKGKQLAVAKRLAESGVTAKDIAGATRWLKSHEWRTGGVDMFLVEKEHGKWVMAGKPDGKQPQKVAPPKNLQTDSYRGDDEAHWLGQYAEQNRSKTA